MFARSTILACLIAFLGTSSLFAAAPATKPAPAKKEATPAPAPGSPDAIAEEIFNLADKLHNQKLSMTEYQTAITIVQQYAMTLPAKGGRDKGGDAAAGPVASPDLNNDKHVSLEEFKSVFPALLKQAEAQVAALRKQAGLNPNGTPKKKY